MMNISLSKVKKPLKLQNSGNLQIVFLGVGSAFVVKNYQTNFLLIKGDTHILVDFGMTGGLALNDVLGLSPLDIRVVLPTHSHADHVGGLECLTLLNRYVSQRLMDLPKTKMVIDENYQRCLWTHTLQGGLEWNEKGPHDAEKLQFHDFFDVLRPKWKTFQPRETFEIDVGPIHLDIFRTSHIPEQAKNWESSFISYGLFIDDRIFISCDTKFDSDLIYYYSGKSEVMFHDVQFFKGAVHPYLGDLKTLDPEIQKKMILIHYGDDWKKQDIGKYLSFAKQGYIYEFK